MAICPPESFAFPRLFLKIVTLNQCNRGIGSSDSAEALCTTIFPELMPEANPKAATSLGLAWRSFDTQHNLRLRWAEGRNAVDVEIRMDERGWFCFVASSLCGHANRARPAVSVGNLLSFVLHPSRLLPFFAPAIAAESFRSPKLA